jgi:LysM repeat protein
MKRIRSILLALGLLATLVVPAFAAARTANCSAQYTVQPGDNLFRIGASFGVPWPQIAAANNLAIPSLIFPGQVLCIPAGPGTPAPSLTPGPSATPVPTATGLPNSTPVPTVVPVPSTFVIPTFSIVSVVKDTSVTIQTANFPPNQAFNGTMGPIGSRGIGGVSVATTNSGAGGAFTATFNIPASLAGKPQIAIRLQSASGYYAFNWFWNVTAP